VVEVSTFSDFPATMETFLSSSNTRKGKKEKKNESDLMCSYSLTMSPQGGSGCPRE
jgi:hypothetical protein